MLIYLYDTSLISGKHYQTSKNEPNNNPGKKLFRFGIPKGDAIKIAVTSCGDKTIMEQTLVMIKSVVMFSNKELHFIIVVDNDRLDYVDQVIIISIKLR